MKYLRLSLLLCGLAVVSLGAQATAPKTEITKWPDGRQAAVAITYDDSTINQFRIALPLMNERKLVGTFFVITGQTPGSKNMPTFVGRPIMDILKESATVPTSKDNVYERTSMLRYLTEIQREDVLIGLGRGAGPNPGNLASVDAALAKLRESGKTFAVGAVPYVPVRSEEAQPCAPARAGNTVTNTATQNPSPAGNTATTSAATAKLKFACFKGRVRADSPDALSWDEFRKAAAQGHEIANHAVSHARLTVLDEPNTLYEVEKARDELRAQMGEKHLFSLEAPYGIEDEHSRQMVISRFPLLRNWVNDSDAEFMDGIMRGDKRDPATSTKPYLEWERGPIGRTATAQEMKDWIATSEKTGTWLVLVIHGIDGVGYEPIPIPIVTSYFDDIKAASDAGKLWVATYQDGAKYIRERMKSKVDTKQNGQAIEVTITNAFDPKVYDVPLTARTTVPAAWTSAQVAQGKDVKKLAVEKDSTGSFVQYHVLPNGGPAKITRAQ
jgi:peptidoglycan/xylan/chitin deacetylase (PgdA/CDA1 family)